MCANHNISVNCLASFPWTWPWHPLDRAFRAVATSQQNWHMSWNLFTIPRVVYTCLTQMYYKGRDCLSVGKGTFLRSPFCFLVPMWPVSRFWGMVCLLGIISAVITKWNSGFHIHFCSNLMPVFPKWSSCTPGMHKTIHWCVRRKYLSFYLLALSNLFIIKAPILFLFLKRSKTSVKLNI